MIPSMIPSQIPSHLPSINPTHMPSNLPSDSPSKFPSREPSMNPTINPTVYSGYYVGDMKVSFYGTNHDYWLLCDGSYVNQQDYPLLYSLIGHTFDDDNNQNSSIFFAVPNATGRVISMDGSNGYNIGESTGSITTNLNSDNIPSHSHYVMYNGECDENWAYPSAYPYLARYCPDTNGVVYEPYTYDLRSASSSNIPNVAPTSSVGSSEAFSIMQITV